jgi:hypothetical protein
MLDPNPLCCRPTGSSIKIGSRQPGDKKNQKKFTNANDRPIIKSYNAIIASP